MGRSLPARRAASFAVRLRCLTAFALTLALAAMQVPPAVAAPAVAVVGGGPHAYVEQAAPTNIGGGLSIAGGAAYDGQYVEFEVDAATADEVLSLEPNSAPDAADGAVSVVGSTVYLGDGTAAAPIGTVDGVFDGRQGRKLRVNFSSPFTNPGFEEGELGWTALERRIDLGVDGIAGHPTVDTSTYPSGTHPTRSWWTPPNEDDDAPAGARYGVQTTTSGEPTEGASALQLQSSMTTAGGCDVVHGPAAHSSAFEAAAGDTIYFDWRAYAGSDAYHVFGYIVDDHGRQTEVLDAFTWDAGGSTNWATKETVIPATGNYRFVFVAGTFDATCGMAAGARLLIDNVRVFGNKVGDAVVEALGRKLQYANSSDDPAASRTVTVTAQSADGGAGTGEITVDITPVDDAPTLDAPSAVTFENTADDDDFSSVAATMTATDPDSSTIAFDVDGGTGTGDWRATVGTYATVRVHRSGAYVVEPRDAAIEAQTVADSETFTVLARADGASDTATLTVHVGIHASPPGAPSITEVTAGDSRATVTWDPGSWIGGSRVTDHVVQYSSDGGGTWTSFDDGVDPATTTTVTGLTPGTAYEFRVAAVNASGTGDMSAAGGPVTPRTTQTPVVVEATDLVYGDTAILAIDGGDGTGATTYTVTDGPCRIDGDSVATTGVGTCTIEAAKAGDTTYYPATGAITITVAPRQLTVAGAAVATRAYDATTTATIRGARLVGLVGGDDVTLTGHTAGTFSQSGVGIGLVVSTAMALTGSDAGNYTLTQPRVAGTIAPRSLTVVDATVATKVYDGTTDAVIVGATLRGVVGSEDVTLAGHTTGTYAGAAAGTAVPVTTAMALTGTDAANYRISQPELTGTIAVRALTVTDASVTSRTYDGTTAATVTGARLAGVVGGDDVSLVDHGRGTFTSDEVGRDIPVVTGMSLVGDDAASYTVVQPVLTGTITTRPVTVVDATVRPKAANGGRAASITGARLHGTVDGDDVALTHAGAGAFVSADVGDDVQVRSFMKLAGDDADQYTLTQPSLTGSIVPAVTMSTGTTGATEGAPVDEVEGTVQRGDRVVTQLCNLAPGSALEVVLDAGQRLGGHTVGDDGCVIVSAVLPDDVAAGRHTLGFAGTDLTGSPVTSTRDVTVAAPAAADAPAAPDGPLPATGAALTRLALLALLAIAAGTALTRSGRGPTHR